MSELYYVYRLMNGNTCVYVGITTDIARRLYLHCNDKVFDSHEVVGKYPFEMARALERRYILKFKPKYNKEVLGYRYVDMVVNDLKRSMGECSVDAVNILIEALGIETVTLNNKRMIRVEDGRMIRKVYREFVEGDWR